MTAGQLREQVRQALARRAAGVPPGLPAEGKPGEDPVAVLVKRPSQSVTEKAGKAPPRTTRTPPGGEEPEGRQRHGKKTGSGGAARSQAEKEETADERAARIKRLARRARDNHPGRDLLSYSRSAQPQRMIDATVYWYGQIPGTSGTTWWTADVHGRLIGHPATGFQVTAGSELVSADGQVIPAGWWAQINPLRFEP